MGVSVSLNLLLHDILLISIVEALAYFVLGMNKILKLFLVLKGKAALVQEWCLWSCFLTVVCHCLHVLLLKFAEYFFFTD